MRGRCRSRGSDLAFAARPGWTHSVALKISVRFVSELYAIASSRKGSVALACSSREMPVSVVSCCEREEVFDEGDFVGAALGRAFELCLSDRAEGFNALERGIG